MFTCSLGQLKCSQQAYRILPKIFKNAPAIIIDYDCNVIRISLIAAQPKYSYRKNSKIWDTSNNCHNCPKNRKVWCNIALMHPKDADGMANSVDPDQTASSEAV